MNQTEHYALGLRRGVRGDGVELMDRLARARVTAGGRLHPVPGGMVETAENLRRQYGRQEQDEFALRSQQATAAAVGEGKFDDEIVAVTVPGGRGRDPIVITMDEHPRPETTMADLAALRPVRLGTDLEATVTAGNATGQNDGAAMCVVTTRDKAKGRGLRPFLQVRSWAVAGVGPEVMGIGPVPATAAALDRAGLKLAHIDLIELKYDTVIQIHHHRGSASRTRGPRSSRYGRPTEEPGSSSRASSGPTTNRDRPPRWPRSWVCAASVSRSSTSRRPSTAWLRTDTDWSAGSVSTRTPGGWPMCAGRGNRRLADRTDRLTPSGCPLPMRHFAACPRTFAPAS